MTLTVRMAELDKPVQTSTNARRSIAQTDDWLVKEGQLTIELQTTDVLDALVSHHVLVRTGEPTGYSFQHQQFQEWYTSNDAERAMLEGASAVITAFEVDPVLAASCTRVWGIAWQTRSVAWLFRKRAALEAALK